jgi:3-hydroxyacyl-CoA dehydrogenase
VGNRLAFALLREACYLVGEDPTFPTTSMITLKHTTTSPPRPQASRNKGIQILRYRPITLHKEIPGFVGNRLAFALLREACYLVGEGAPPPA